MVSEMRAAAARLADAQPPVPMPTAATSRRRGLRWWRLSNASPRRTEPGARDGGSGALATRKPVPPCFVRPMGQAAGGTPDVHLPPRGRRAPPSQACVGGEASPPRDGFPPTRPV
jgi:hypothetical protein